MTHTPQLTGVLPCLVGESAFLPFSSNAFIVYDQSFYRISLILSVRRLAAPGQLISNVKLVKLLNASFELFMTFYLPCITFVEEFAPRSSSCCVQSITRVHRLLHPTVA